MLAEHLNPNLGLNELPVSLNRILQRLQDVQVSHCEEKCNLEFQNAEPISPTLPMPERHAYMHDL